MNFFTARALQISTMTSHQVNDLHDRERERGSCLLPFEIQKRFGFGSVADWYAIPAESFSAHVRRVEKELVEKKVAASVEYRDEKSGEVYAAKPWEAIVAHEVANVHAFDWRVRQAIDAGTMNFGSAAGDKSEGLAARVRRAKSKEPERMLKVVE